MLTLGEIISIFVSLIGLLIMGIALFRKMKQDRITLEVKLEHTDNKIDILEKMFNLEIAHRNEMNKMIQSGVDKSLYTLTDKIMDNAALAKENTEANKQEHLIILVRLDDLKNLLLKYEK
jgi:hypothetical protein